MLTEERDQSQGPNTRVPGDAMKTHGAASGGPGRSCRGDTRGFVQCGPHPADLGAGTGSPCPESSLSLPHEGDGPEERRPVGNSLSPGDGTVGPSCPREHGRVGGCPEQARGLWIE